MHFEILASHLHFARHPTAASASSLLKFSGNIVGESRETHFKLKDSVVEVENLRGKEDSVDLDTAGFRFIHQPAKHTSFKSDEEIKAEYHPESIKIIKQATGASRVVTFDHTIRRRQIGAKDQAGQPASLVHVDQLPKAAIARVGHHLPASDVPRLLQKRFQIINLWRPISHPALDWPLAVCDYRSVDSQKDTIPVVLVYPDLEEEAYGVAHNPAHKWKYVRGMTPEEAILIKCFDSIQDEIDPFTPEDAPLRESIELRTLVFYD
ncbi:hypothetical protein FA15DRAFT_680897 [Coprinopsis marcescibilis]|uniref:Methyltransferase n=1 Tax=Coprinopsis marcescibilis TaxID=230819 RepID=A0A5C3KUW2_COPMA|nr:hypothetical protein FA15DRAFT_680897 [Coprinopsis marcescibilis]